MKQAKQPSKRAAKATQNYTKTSKAAVRRAVVASGVVAGKTEKQIAAEAGISRDRVAQIKAEPETSKRVAELLAPHREKIDKLITTALDSIERRLNAPRISMFGFVIENPETQTPYDDTDAQSKATNDLIKLLQAAEPKQDAGPQNNFFVQLNQLQQIAQVYLQQRQR